MDVNKPAGRSFLRFGIRDLLWAMIVVGLAAGWAMEYRRHEAEERTNQLRFRDYINQLAEQLVLLSDEVRLLREKSGITVPVVRDPLSGESRFSTPSLDPDP